MSTSTLGRTIGAGFAALVLMAAPVGAQEVTLGLATTVTSMDPHFHASNINIAMHVFDRLIEQASAKICGPDSPRSGRR